MMLSYLKTFERFNLKAIPVKADTGPIGGNLSHEFIILADTGESEIFTDSEIFNFETKLLEYNDVSLKKLSSHFSKFYSSTSDLHDVNKFQKQVPKKNQIIKKGVEVGHIFYFGQKYSKSLNAIVNTRESKSVNVYMGSYGIGVSRLVGAIIEANYNNNFMKWPKSVTPFQAVIINLGKDNDTVTIKANNLYQKLIHNKFDVILDDTDANPSSKFKNFELIGIPFQIIVGSKHHDDEFEFKELGKDSKIVNLDSLISILKEEYSNC